MIGSVSSNSGLKPFGEEFIAPFTGATAAENASSGCNCCCNGGGQTGVAAEPIPTTPEFDAAFDRVNRVLGGMPTWINNGLGMGGLQPPMLG